MDQVTQNLSASGGLWVGVHLSTPSRISVAAPTTPAELICGGTGLSGCPEGTEKGPGSPRGQKERQRWDGRSPKRERRRKRERREVRRETGSQAERERGTESYRELDREERKKPESKSLGQHGRDSRGEGEGQGKEGKKSATEKAGAGEGQTNHTRHVKRNRNTKTGSQAEKEDQSKKWGVSRQIPCLRCKDTGFCSPLAHTTPYQRHGAFKVPV